MNSSQWYYLIRLVLDVLRLRKRRQDIDQSGGMDDAIFDEDSKSSSEEDPSTKGVAPLGASTELSARGTTHG